MSRDKWGPMWLGGALSSRDSPPPEVSVLVEFGAQSRRGAERPVNTDHYLVLRLGRHQETLLTSLPDREVPRRFDEYGYAMLVADGVGGHGEAASRLAIATLAHLAIHFGRWNVRVDDDIAHEVMARAERFYRKVDSRLRRQPSERAHGLQTTLTAVYSAGRDLFLAHVGHSRAYLVRNREILRLTRDHTLADEPARGQGPLIDVAAATRDLHHILMETIGTTDPAGPMIDIDRCRLADGDVVLLCTNGLTDVLSEAQIAGVLSSNSTPPEQCATLVNLAVNAGARDDVTAVVSRYFIPEGDDTAARPAR
jgi:serine/threonine protein phosphatase PrpC